MLDAAVTRRGAISPIVLFWRSPADAGARVVFEERRFAVSPNALWRVIDAMGLAGGDPARVRARTEARLLSVEWPMPRALAGVSGQATLLTLTFEPAGEGTALTLTQAGFGRGPDWDAALGLHRRWWPGVLDSLASGLPN